jgi:hypothetical protein
VVTAVPLTQGKLNVVRAAFKAGITPSKIARQFGISQSDIRKGVDVWIVNRWKVIAGLQIRRRSMAGRINLDSEHDLERQGDLEYLDGIELEFRIQATLDGSRFAKAVLLAGKQ